MSHNSNPQAIARRDWLKSLSLGSLGALAATSVQAQQDSSAKSGRVRGIIFMVSDGMSPGVLTMAQNFSRLTRNKGTHWWDLINHAKAARGLMDTASANSMVTDSAAASSAWGGGQRVNNGMINYSPAGKAITPIGQILKDKGHRIGLVTTATVTHATPAGFAAAVTDRNKEDSIAEQYLDRVDVILGGGSAFFDPKTRADKKDLFTNYETSGYEIVRHRDAMLGSRSKKLLGTFSKGYIPYSIDRNQSKELQTSVPTLAEMAAAAGARFLAGTSPFLLQIEGARIDHAAHLNDIGALLHEQIAFDDALGQVLELTAQHPDILVVVTSDHGNSNPGLNGMGASYKNSSKCFQRIAAMKESHESLFARWTKKPQQDLAAMIRENLGFALEANQKKSLVEILQNKDVIEWNDQLAKPEGLLGQFAGNHTGVGWTGTTHTSDPTIVTAIGPQCERFSGMVVNTDVFRHFTELLT
ncbi:MAG: alkaline phosphatase [Akkermansiaceae bacterium]